MGAILVTGAAGFVGSHLCEFLLGRGERVIGVDNFDPYYDPEVKEQNAAQVRARVAEPERFVLHAVDIRELDGLAEIVRSGNVDRIVHLAALAGVRASVARPAEYADVNLRGTANVLEAARQRAIRHVVVVSTSSVYGATETIPFVETDVADRPLAPYPATKRAAEMLSYSYHHLHGLNVTVVRLFTVYGPRCRPDMMAYKIAHSLLFGSEIVVYESGQLRRDWTYVDDIVRGLVGALDQPRGYEIYNLGRGQPTLLADFVNYLEGLSGKRVNARVAPAPATEPRITYADVSKARAHFGYDPQVSVQEGLAHFWEWFCAVPGVGAPRG